MTCNAKVTSAGHRCCRWFRWHPGRHKAKSWDHGYLYKDR